MFLQSEMKESKLDLQITMYTVDNVSALLIIHES